MRIMQEVLLGVGGVRLLRALGVQPSVFHMNEGHAAFLTLELVREKLAAGLSFAEAMAKTKAAVHLHHPHARRGRPRPLQPRPDGLRAAEADGPVEAFPRRLDGAWAGLIRKNDARILLHDGAGLETFPRRQRRQRIARPGQPPNVARPLAGQTGG